MNAPKTPESKHWQELYASPELVARRKKGHLEKLKKLGIFDADRGAHVLDLCCGQGEMLDLLSERGFSNLTGVDQIGAEELNKDEGERKWKYVQALLPTILRKRPLEPSSPEKLRTPTTASWSFMWGKR